jgi:enolase
MKTSCTLNYSRSSMNPPDSDSTIASIHARQVLDSRGNPTIEVDVCCGGGAKGRAIVPSGASTGKHEAKELRDGDPAHYCGKGVRRAVANVREAITPRLVGMCADEQTRIDQTLCELDGTPDKSRLGANAILGVSLACAHAAAATRNLPLWRYLAGGTGVSPVNDRRDAGPTVPMPMVNLISGGLHAGGNLEFQDFLLLPIGARSYSEALEMAVSVSRALGETLTRHGFEGLLVGDEGGFGPRLGSNLQAVEMILEAIEKAGLAPGRGAAIALDVASTQFFHDGRYHLGKKGSLDSDEMIAWLKKWVSDYPILSIEDGLAEDDWQGWRRLTQALGDRVQLIGDDLFVTNPERLRGKGRQQYPHQIESDRHIDGDFRRDRTGPLRRLPARDLRPERRHGRHHHRRPGRCHGSRSDQDRLRGPQRAPGEI